MDLERISMKLGKKSYGDLLMKLILQSFPEGLRYEEGLALNNVLYEHGITVVKDRVKGTTQKLGLTLRAIAEISCALVNRGFRKNPPQEGSPLLEGVTPDNFLNKFSSDLALEEEVRNKLLSNPSIDKIEPSGSGIFNLTDVEYTNY